MHRHPQGRGGRLFLLPALVLLGALVVYPIVYSVFRSFFDQPATGFVGLDNYTAIFTDDSILTARQEQRDLGGRRPDRRAPRSV